MADEPQLKRDATEPLIILLIILFILQSFVFPGVSTFFEERLGIDISSFFAIDYALTADTPIGTKIIQASESDIWSEPGGGNSIGIAERGALGEIVGGPVLRNGILWWQVRYDESGTVGWVHEAALLRDYERDRVSLKESTPHGTRVIAAVDTEVLSDIQEGFVTGLVAEGERGIIVGGPVLRGAKRYWQVLYEDGTVGWVAEEALVIDAVRDIKGVNDTTPFGTEIVTIGTIDVWSAPRGGVVLGQQKEGTQGVLTDGSVTIGINRWWDVAFEMPPSGWVSERDIERRFALVEAASRTAHVYVWVSYIVSALLIAGILYTFFKLRNIFREEKERFKTLAVKSQRSSGKGNKWDRVLEHVESENPNDWRLAILEADIILDDLMDKMDIPGETLGERLKHIDRSDMTTLDKAWEAHKARNMIAHQGGDFVLTQREAKRITDLYREVFEELQYI